MMGELRGRERRGQIGGKGDGHPRSWWSRRVICGFFQSVFLQMFLWDRTSLPPLPAHMTWWADPQLHSRNGLATQA